jgi:hypothetical protein
MQTLPGTPGVPNQVFHCLEFDTASGCFVFLSAPDARTWGYRYNAAAANPLSLR